MYRVFTWSNDVDDTNGIDDNSTDDLKGFVNRKFDTNFNNDEEALNFLQEENILVIKE